jgi:DivIVA domain-containing protein
MLATIASMVVEPRTLRQVDFRYRSRGYNPDDVDDFLERVAAGLEELHTLLDEASAGGGNGSAGGNGTAGDAAAAASPARPAIDLTEYKMRRLLRDSQHEADEVVETARERAVAILNEAEASAAELVRMAAYSLPISGQVRDLDRQLASLRSRRACLESHLLAFEHFLVTQGAGPAGPGTGVPGPGPCFHVLQPLTALG